MKHLHKTDTSHWITSYGFTEETKTVSGLPCQYEKCITSESGLYNTWVGVDFNKRLVHIYVEYECGGEVNMATIDFSNVDMDEECDFMTELDAIIDMYMED